MPIYFASVLLHGVLASSQKFDLLNVPGIPSSACTYLLPVSALALGFGLPAIVLFPFVGRIAAIVVLTVFSCGITTSSARVPLNCRLLTRNVTGGVLLS